MPKYVKFRDEHMKKLSNPEYARKYLLLALEDYFDGGDKIEFLAAIRNIVDAFGGATKVASATGIKRDTIYKALDGNPTIETLHDIMGCIGSNKIRKHAIA